MSQLRRLALLEMSEEARDKHGPEAGTAEGKVPEEDHTENAQPSSGPPSYNVKDGPFHIDHVTTYPITLDAHGFFRAKDIPDHLKELYGEKYRLRPEAMSAIPVPLQPPQPDNAHALQDFKIHLMLLEQRREAHQKLRLMDVIEEETGEKISYDDMRPHYAEWLRHDEREQKRREIVRRILALKAVDSEADRDEKGDDVGVESERPCL